jgi:hypothetical protein
MESAMPKEKERPCQPDSRRLLRGQVDGDVAAIVDESLVEQRGAGHRGQELVRDGARDGRHGRDEHAAVREAGGAMRLATAPSTRGPSPMGFRSSGSSSTSSPSIVRNRAAAAS